MGNKKRKKGSSKKSHSSNKRNDSKRRPKKKHVQKVYIVKKPFYKRWWFWLLCFIFLPVVVGLLTSGNNNNSSSKVEKNTSETSQKKEIENKEEQKQTVINLGDEGDSEGLSLKIVDKEERDSIEAMGGYSRYTPEDGGKYALVNITLKNNGNESKGTNNGYFKLVKEEKTYTPSTLIVTGTDERFFTFESLNPGLSASGFIVFEVPKDFTFDGAQIRFDGTGLFNDPIIFNLN